MLAQLEALREASIRPNIQIHSMRFSDGLYPHWNEPYVLFEFDLPALGPVLFRKPALRQHHPGKRSRG
jgi:hypothetical protein